MTETKQQQATSASAGLVRMRNKLPSKDGLGEDIMSFANCNRRTLNSDAQLMQEYLQSTGIIVNAQNDGVEQVAAFQNAEESLWSLCIDRVSEYHIWKTRRYMFAKVRKSCVGFAPRHEPPNGEDAS
jgi:hypothetical protein